MPNTCVKQNELVHHKSFQPKLTHARFPVQFPDACKILLKTQDRVVLEKWIKESLSNIKKNFFSGESVQETETILNNIQFLTISKMKALFFLLLNVDTDIKHKITVNVSQDTTLKLFRFFFDLRKYEVPKFLNSELISVYFFVNGIEDSYITA